jgi:acyl-homoserine lactone acylase PvdQ
MRYLLGLARSGRAAEAQTETDRLRQIEVELRTSGNDYWATQVAILVREVMAWSAQANGNAEEAVALMRETADEEDAIEKVPVTPGPIVPAREQLGYLLLEQNHPAERRKNLRRHSQMPPGAAGPCREPRMLQNSLAPFIRRNPDKCDGDGL